MTTTPTTSNITPDEASALWDEAINGAYDDEPTNDEAECGNCGQSYTAHDGLACPYDGDDDDDDDCEGEEFSGNTVDYLSAYARKNPEFEAKLVAAYEATKHIPYADLPAYDDGDQYNAWNVMNDLHMLDYFEALDAPQEWVEGWMNYTNAN